MTKETAKTILQVVEREPETAYLPDTLPPETQKTLLDIERKIWTRLDRIKNNIYEIGELLVLAKDTLPHGQYKSWIEKTFGGHLPYTTATLYKSIFEEFHDSPEMPELFSLRFLSLLTRHSFPDDLVKVIKDNPAEFDKEDAE